MRKIELIKQGNSIFPILLDGVLNTFILLWSGQLLLCFPEVALKEALQTNPRKCVTYPIIATGSVNKIFCHGLSVGGMLGYWHLLFSFRYFIIIPSCPK